MTEKKTLSFQTLENAACAVSLITMVSLYPFFIF